MFWRRLSVTTASCKSRFLELNARRYLTISREATSTVGYSHSTKRGCLKLIVAGFRGFPYRTSRGELSLQITHLPELLSPCLHPFPTELSDQETKVRNRHLDLWTGRKSVETLLLRSDIIGRIRSFLGQDNFHEVQTPILANEAGGASQERFIRMPPNFLNDR